MSDQSTITITIQGISFTARAPYSAGHVCSAVEATVLNQCRGDNLRNNFAKVIKEAIDSVPGGDLIDTVQLDELHNKFRKYDSEYAFASAHVVDPVEVEAKHIARALVKEEFHKRGLPITANHDKYTTACQRAASLPTVVDEARRRVDAKREAAAATGLLIDGA